MEPKDELFYVGYRELFEKPKRHGYTKYKNEVGKFSLESAKAMTKYTCGDGFGRWYISCDALDGYDGEQFHPKELY